MADEQESRDSKPLEEVIDDFISINDELERLSGLARDLLATSEQLDAARKEVGQAASEAADTYQAAIKESDQRIKKALSDSKKSLVEFLEELRQQSASQHADSLEVLNTLRNTAETALESAERDHRNTASSLQSLITLMKDAGRDLADTAASFRSLDPEAMQKQVDTIRAEALLIKKEGRIAIASIALTLVVLLAVLL